MQKVTSLEVNAILYVSTAQDSPFYKVIYDFQLSNLK